MKWPQVRLDECTRIVSGATPKTEDASYWGGPIHWVTPKDLSDNEDIHISKTARTLTPSGVASCSTEILPANAVLFSSRAPIGHVAINTVPMCTNQGFKSFVPEATKLDSRYLYFWLRANRTYLDGLGTGATFKELSKATISKVTIPLPPLDEQKRIADILNAADAIRAKRRHAFDRLDDLARAIFLLHFGDPVANPKGWPTVMLGSLCDVRDGTHDSPKYVSENGYPLVTSKNLTKGFVDLTDVKLISEEDFHNINKRSQVHRGDIIMPMIGTIGSPVLVDHEPSYAIKNIALIKFTATSPCAIFILHLLRSNYFDHVIGMINRGGTQKFISLGDLRKFPIPLPPLSTQHRFASEIAAVESMKAHHKVADKKHNALLSSLEAQAFTIGF